MNAYESDQEMAEKTTSRFNRKGISRRVKYDHRFSFLEEKTRNPTIHRGWIRFSIKREINEGKNDISNHENGKFSEIRWGKFMHERGDV